MNKGIIVLIIASVIGVALLSGCVQSGDSGKNRTAGDIPDLKISVLESTQKIKKFSSIGEIREFLRASAAASYNSAWAGRGDVMGGVKGMPVPMAIPAATSIVTESISAPPTGASDYSKTNIQVEGVDEADFVKNDGRYIYVLAQNKLVIVDAFPAADAGILSSVKMEGRPKELFVNGDRLVVFTEDNSQVLIYPEYDYRPLPRYTTKTTALLYDIKDREKPVELANYSINGNYFRSRMIGDHVYFIVKDEIYYYNDVIDVPVIKQGSVKLMPDVYYFDNPEQNYVFHTIASINIKSRNINAKSFMMGFSDNLYVSEKNIYITYRKNLPVRYYREMQEERFYGVIVPLLPKEAQDKISAVRDSKLDSYEKWEKISSILEETYNRMDENKKQEYLGNIEKAVEEYDIKLAQEREKTVIQKIRIDKGDIEYRTKGEVPGSMLNQFSMDESGDHFRVATTSQFWTGKGSIQFNNVYILDENLNIEGRLEEIAPDERIYSTRFIGSRLYMVTFKRIDPLFVIDLSDPKQPKILGKLKIPGYSDYLHPYDENHIIGVGKETEDNQWGGASIKGVKLSLFDVSDVENPRQLDKYEIGRAGTDSEALRDHRAFLFDKKKNLLVIPVREMRERERFDWGYGYRQKVWQGAYFFGVTPEDGFKLRGKVSHLDDYEEPEYYWSSPGAVRRSLYMDDVLYTVSARKIMVSNLTDAGKIKSVELPFEKDKYYEYGWR